MNYITKKKRRASGNLMVFLGAVLIMLIIIGGAIWRVESRAAAEDEEDNRWILCQPDSFVYVRRFPKKSSEEVGYLELGNGFRTDGKVVNGYIHAIGITDAGEGWVCKAYVVEDRPEVETSRAWVTGKGRVAIRRNPGGKRVKWIRPGAEVVLYAWSEEWAVTNKGIIMIRYLESET